jgi:hypothetical protein
VRSDLATECHGPRLDELTQEPILDHDLDVASHLPPLSPCGSFSRKTRIECSIRRMSIEPTYTLRADGLAAQHLDDEVVVLDLVTSSYLLLNATGATLWPVLQSGATLARLVEVLVAEFEIAGDIAERDVTAFLAELERLGLVVVSA